LNVPRALTVFDGRETASGLVTHVAYLDLGIGGHTSRQTPLFVTRLAQHPVIIGLPWLRYHKADVRLSNDTIVFDSPFCHRHCMTTTIVVKCRPQVIRSGKILDIATIGAAPMMVLSRKKNHTIFTVTMRDIDKALAVEKPLDLSKLPEEYREFADLFSRELSDKLPPRRPYDHKIPLIPGAVPPFGPLYGMSQNELLVLKKYLEENLTKGFIRASSSPAAAPVIFVKKPSGGLRFCVDYRGLNSLTIKNRYPLPLIKETLARLARAKFFTKLDIIAAFNKVRIAKGEEWLTAFRTRYGLYEYLVMPFGLSNAPSSFQNLINDVLRPYLDDFVTAYIDDILIFSETLKEHKQHVRLVLGKLMEAGLHLDINKCEFHATEVKYLGLIISDKGIKMDPEKITAVQQWETPESVKDIQSFLGFANFYRRFIAGFSELAAPLTALTRKGVVFKWIPGAEKAFQQLKKAFTTAPILQNFDVNKPSTVETDSSDHVTAGVLSQPDDQGQLRPVAYFSTKMTPAECNYEIYDKELLAVIRAFEEWRPELEGATHRVKVITDHKNLEYFMTTKLLSRRQARWSEYLSRFDFELQYRPGKLNARADALTRRSADCPSNDSDPRKAIQQQTMLKPHNISEDIRQDLQLAPANVTPEPGPLFGPRPATIQEELQRRIIQTYTTDPLAQTVTEALRTGARRVKRFPLAECELRENLVFYRDRLWVPENDELRLMIFRDLHDSSVGGHPGKTKLMELFSRHYWWPSWTVTVKQYVRNCATCMRIKPSRMRYQGALKPLPISDRRWRDISLDFIISLPPSPNEWGVPCKNMLVVVDRLTKQGHFIPCNNMDALATARMFYFNVFKHHGLPNSIVSDRGTQFVSHFWLALCDILGINASLSTAFHPETDGQTERTNALIETYLRAYVSYLQDDWVKWCPSGEFAYNNHVSESTNVSPFFANTGQHPRMGIEPFTVNTTLAERDQAQQRIAQSFATTMDKINTVLRSELVRAQAVQEDFANRHREHAPKYQVGDEVYVDTRNMFTQRPHKKLDHKLEGPFKITQVVSPHAYKVNIPKDWAHHPVFHTSLLRRGAIDPLPGQLPPIPLPRIRNGEEEWPVTEVVDSRMHKNRLQFRTRWEGAGELTWEPFFAVRSTEAIEAYFNRYPERPGFQTWREWKDSGLESGSESEWNEEDSDNEMDED